MNKIVRNRILRITKATDISKVALIQNLWNNYGTLSRIYLTGNPKYPSVIVKHIQIPKNQNHPKGFAGTFSQQRKIKSYQVETYWYQHYNDQIAASKTSPTPKCLDAFNDGSELFLLLEDLSTRGFRERKYRVTWEDVAIGLDWLAHFHAQFLHSAPNGLWECGTYWHLATRPDELNVIRNTHLHMAAPFIDAQLRTAKYQTFVHGDAKLANLCFQSNQPAVAAVDFQYVGKGCGMKDLAYFVGSCMNEQQCEHLENKILHHYFATLRTRLTNSEIDIDDLEAQWRNLYHTAWADFQRFLMGWSPVHRKNHGYAQRITDGVVKGVFDALLETAKSAAVSAGKYIRNKWQTDLPTSSKGLTGASDIVTPVDIHAQKIILDTLAGSMNEYDIGLLAEEGEHDNSRLKKHAFWAIDPLDGTQYFAEGKPGFATSIALVDQSGQTILGVVYDPVEECLYHAVRGKGLYINGKKATAGTTTRTSEKIPLYTDRSIQQHPRFSAISAIFDIHLVGGAVMNTIHVMTNAPSCYWKAPKKSLGGCAIWDLAAVTLMLQESGGETCFFDGRPIELNRPESIYFNDMGFIFTSPNLTHATIEELVSPIVTQSTILSG